MTPTPPPQPSPSAPPPVALPYATPVPGDEAVATVIPYRNPQALIAYYLGLFSLFPFLGLFLAIPAFVLGIRGLRAAGRNPALHGKAHAWIGIICGGVFGVIWLLVDALMIVTLVANRS